VAGFVRKQIRRHRRAKDGLLPPRVMSLHFRHLPRTRGVAWFTPLVLNDSPRQALCAPRTGLSPH
jgi:hypothetical protein